MKSMKYWFLKIVTISVLIEIFLVCNHLWICKGSQINQTSIIGKKELLDGYLRRFQNDEYMKPVYQAWLNVLNHQNYRLTNVEDYVIPLRVNKDKYLLGHIAESKSSYIYGSVCGTQEYANHVFLLIDTTIEGNKKFSLLIIYKNANNAYKTQWLIKNEDLSNTIISKNSGNILIERYYSDGTNENSRICWNKRNSKFYISKK